MSAGFGSGASGGRRASGAGDHRTPGPGHRAVDLGQAATDRNLRLATHDPRVAASLLKSPWLVMDAFVAQDGHLVMLALLNVAPGDRHFHDCVPASLSVLRAATLHPGARAATAAAVLSDPSRSRHAGADGHRRSRRGGAGLGGCHRLASRRVQSGGAAAEHGRGGRGGDRVRPVGSAAPVHPASAKKRRPERSDAERFAAGVEARLRPARAALRESGGIRAILSMLLRGAKHLPAPNADAARALCCRALLSLARIRRSRRPCRPCRWPGGSRRLCATRTGPVEPRRRRRRRTRLTRPRPRGTPSGPAGVRDGKPLESAASTAVEAGAEFHAAVELIALTAGGAAKGSTAAAASDAATAPLRRLERHAIAAATRVQYPHGELLQLIHEHLTNAGMRDAAAALAAEARLGGLGAYLASPSQGLGLGLGSSSGGGGARPGELAPRG